MTAGCITTKVMATSTGAGTSHVLLLLLLLLLCPAAAALLSSSQSSAVATMLAPLAFIPSARIDDSTGSSSSSGSLNRTELPVDLLEKYSAYCLDGTPFSYYFRPATTAAAANN